MSQSAVKRIVSSTNSTELFRESISLFEELLERIANIPKRPIPDHVWDIFAQLDEEQRAAAIEQISSYTELLAEAVAEGISLMADKRLAWFAMKKLKLTPPSDLLELIEEDDCVEVYNVNGIQIFRSLTFYKIVSYSVAEITLYPWDRLYNRDPQITQQIIEQGFIKGFSGTTSAYKLTIPDHDVTEAMSLKPRSIHVKFGWLAPLIDQPRSVGAIFATWKILKPVSGRD